MPEQRDRPLDPPQRLNPEGEVRRVGVELEFNGPSASDAAELVKDIFGGEIHELSHHRFEIQTTEFGRFVSELDTAYAHPNARLIETQGPDSGLVALDKSLSKMVGDISGGLVPTEIVTPPLPYTALSRLTKLLDDLRLRGAGGTDSSLVSGFGLHLNVEVASQQAKEICLLLKAYLISSPKLRDLIQLDPTRTLMPYVDPFPQQYVERVLSPNYSPDLDTLIGDYLADNPTRNRELDLLPLFKHLDEPRILAALNDERIKSRPAYHYRLPDMNLTDKAWSVVTEWNRWVQVERLANDPEALALASTAKLERHNEGDFSVNFLDSVLKKFSF